MVYLGSKNRLAKELIPIIQSYITAKTNGYLEPFVGGANVIDKIQHDKKYGFDIHEPLIELLKWVQNPKNKLPKTITEEEYLKVRDNKGDFPLWYIGLVGFCATFGSRYFEGFARGKKNDGSPRDFPNERIRNIERQRPNLNGIIFQNRDFLTINPNDLEGYVIYCDPPYRNTKEYATESFPYEEFYIWCRELSKNNIVLVSEYNMPDGFQIVWEKEHKTLINSLKNADDFKNIRIERLYKLGGV